MNAKNKKKHPGGSGRGKTEVIVNDEIARPDCHECGNFMRSHGPEWHCTTCNARCLKVKKDEGIKAYNDSKGFDVARAESHARKCEKKKRLIITSAQNNSECFIKGLKSLKQAAEFYKCELAVIPSHYRNVTLWSKGDKKEFDPLIVPYLVSSTIHFGNYQIHSDIKIQPTAVNPLSAMDSIGGADSLIVGHPQQMRTPVAAHGFPKQMYTTGSVTNPNYTIGKAGAKGNFHHSQSALILELYKGFVYVRQLNMDDNGHIYDLDVKFTPSGYSAGHRIEALACGDEHWKFNITEKETYSGKDSIVKTLQPKWIARHDALDGFAGSHHHEKNPMLQYIKHHSGDNDYRVELDECIDAINRTTPQGATSLIVASNHHDHLMQYLLKADANKDHQNAKFISEMQLAMREAADKGENYDPFYLYCKDRLTCKFEFLSRNEPFYIGGVDFSSHGDCGINGARGSAKGLAKTPDKMVIGHSHTPHIYQGIFQVGTSTGRMEYAKGLSSWSNTHCIQYKNGKRALIDIYNGRHCAPRGKL
jgi:hypothetical protein